jgi:hypothetical protein
VGGSQYILIQDKSRLLKEGEPKYMRFGFYLKPDKRSRVSVMHGEVCWVVFLVLYVY